jgi:hypothetical protein
MYAGLGKIEFMIALIKETVENKTTNNVMRQTA